jgi:hypothetical protein
MPSGGSGDVSSQPAVRSGSLCPEPGVFIMEKAMNGKLRQLSSGCLLVAVGAAFSACGTEPGAEAEIPQASGVESSFSSASATRQSAGGSVGELTCAILKDAIDGPLVEADNAGRVLVFNIDYPEGWRRDGFGTIFSPQRDFGQGNVIAINMQQRGSEDPDTYFRTLAERGAQEVGDAAYGSSTIRLFRRGEGADALYYTLLPQGSTHVELWVAHGGEYDDSACPDALPRLKERLLRTLRPNAQAIP